MHAALPSELQLQLDAANADLIVNGAITKLCASQATSSTRARRYPTPDDEISDFRLQARRYFEDQPRETVSLFLLSPTPSSSMNSSPERQLKPIDSVANHRKRVRTKGVNKRRLLAPPRKIVKRHHMTTRSQSHRVKKCRFYHLDELPQMDEL